MDIHSSTRTLSKKLLFFLPLSGLMALTVFWTTLARNVYPGYSATLTGASVGLIAQSGADHPVFALLLRAFVSADLVSLPLSVNLFSALCGTLCVMFIYHLVSRLVLFLACETGGGAEKLNYGIYQSNREIPQEVMLSNCRMVPVAITGGLTAAFLLTFMLPFWSASTRVHTAPFDLLLALMAFDLLLTHDTASRGLGRAVFLAASCFLFSIGLFECASFLLLLPCYVFFVAFVLFFSARRKTFCLLLVLCGFAAAACSLLAFVRNLSEPQPAGFVSFLVFGAARFASHHYHEMKGLFPHTGWGLILVQTALPALILLFGVFCLFKNDRKGKFPVMILLTVTSIPTLLNLAFSPYFFFKRTGHLPVFGCAVIASATAIVIAAALKMLAISPDSPSEARDAGDYHKILVQKRKQVFGRSVATGLLMLLSVLGLLTPWLSYRGIDTRASAFADEIASAMVRAMGDRTWLISNGCLDNHLLLQARFLRHPLTLVPLRTGVRPSEVSGLGTKIAADPVFEGLNRIRLQNALSIGTLRFIQEWLKNDPTAVNHVMAFISPDIWTACGYRAIPEGVAFGGVPLFAVPEIAKIVEQNRAFDALIAPSLADPMRETAQLSVLRKELRMKASFAANELGVLLEEMNRFEDAYQSYVRAGKLDPMSLSANVNAYALACAKGIHPEAVDRLLKNIKSLMGDASVRGRSLTGILQTYGTIRQPDFYKQQSAMWTATGNPLIAAAKITKAAALTKEAGVKALVDNASFYLQAGALEKTEECCRAALEKEPGNVDALATMASLALSRHKPEEAEAWLDKAVRGGAQESKVLHETIVLAMLKKDDARAERLLSKATQAYPDDLRYWTLLAEVLLKQNATQEVEFKVLPAMQKALKTPNHYLIQAVRGFLLRKKGPRFYKEARVKLLQALAMNAMMPEVWSTLFDVDLAIGNPDFIEADAKSRLVVEADNALANYLMGSVSLTRNALQQAEDFLRRSVEKHPTAAACNDLAETLRRLKRLGEAETFARQALAIESGMPPALDTLACVLVDAGRYNEAAQVAEKAVAAAPNGVEYQLTLLRAQVKLGDKEAVRQRLEILSGAKAVIPASLQNEIKAMR